MDLIERFNFFFQPFETVAYQKSLSDRGQDDQDLSLSFGQVDVRSWQEILQLLDLKPHTALLDLGSGAGKAALSAAYFNENLQVVGVERLPSLCDWSKHIQEEFAKQVSEEAASRVKFVCQDFFTYDLYSFQTILVTTTSFDDELIKKLALFIESAPVGAQIISIGRALRSPQLKKILSGAWRMGWQPDGHKIAVYAYLKTSD